MRERTRKERKSEGANTCWFSPETPATLHLHPSVPSLCPIYPADKYLNISLSQQKDDEHGALPHLHTPGTKCCHLWIFLFSSTFFACNLYRAEPVQALAMNNLCLL